MRSTRARQLRSNPTEAEKRLWSKLRLKQAGGHRFRRQVPIGPYVVDFACLARRLIIEVDGGQHSESAIDGIRDQRLAEDGYRVLRFWNNEVLGNLEGVLATIQAELAG